MVHGLCHKQYFLWVFFEETEISWPLLDLPENFEKYIHKLDIYSKSSTIFQIYFAIDISSDKTPKTVLLQEDIFFLVHLFARDILAMKKMEFEKTKPFYCISFKFQVLVISIYNFFNNKTSLANKWMSFSSSNLALFGRLMWTRQKKEVIFQTKEQLQMKG